MEALGIVAERGMPGRHHHYITFRTDHPGVALADDLRARYPTEMTIVLQHEFWGLEVGEDRFAVGLSFGGVSHRLEIPLDAVTMFADPSVEFGLQFAKGDAAAGDGATAPASPVVTPGEAREPPGEAAPKWSPSIAFARSSPGGTRTSAARLTRLVRHALMVETPLQPRSLTMSRDRPVRVETDTFGPSRCRRIATGARRPSARLQNFRIGGESMPMPLVRALGIVKQAAAVANRRWATSRRAGATPSSRPPRR